MLLGILSTFKLFLFYIFRHTIKICDSTLGLSGFVKLFFGGRIYGGAIHGESIEQFISLSDFVSFFRRAYLRGSLSRGGGAGGRYHGFLRYLICLDPSKEG